MHTSENVLPTEFSATAYPERTRSHDAGPSNAPGPSHIDLTNQHRTPIRSTFPELKCTEL